MKLLLSLAVVLMVGCTALGLATPKDFDQSLASAYGVHTAVITAATTALTNGAINSTDAQQVLTQASSARAMLDAAKAAESIGNTAGAQSDLTLASTALTALQTYLNGSKK
jgi:hypothetical protein